MKSEHWILTVGAALFALMVLFALAPDSLWENSTQRQLLRTAVAPGPMAQMARHNQGAEPLKLVSPADTKVNANPEPARTKPTPGMMNFDRAKTVRFNGIIQQITEMPQQDGQLHVWVDDAKGKETRVSVGPDWFLQYIGCTLTHDTKISGFGYRFDKTGRGPLIYARKITINGKVCRLRNDEGFALWSNRLR